MFSTEETAGYVLGKAVRDFTAGKFLGVETVKQVRKVLDKEALITWTLEGNNTTASLQSGRPLTRAKIKLFYNPYTHYTTAIIDAVCGPGTPKQQIKQYVVRYEIAKEGTFGVKEVPGTRFIEAVSGTADE